MGRRRPNMELIRNERSRMATYHKRKKCLMKKAREFHILCNVDACLMIFGPRISNRPVDVETWPPNRSDVMRILQKFRAKGTVRRKNQKLSDYFEARKKKVEDEINKLRKSYLRAKFSAWDNRLNLLLLDQVRAFAGNLDVKLEAAKCRLRKMKNGQYLMKGFRGSSSSSGTMVGSSLADAMLQKNEAWSSSSSSRLAERQEKKPLSCEKPLDIQLPSPAAYFPTDQSFQHILPYSYINSAVNYSYNYNPMLSMMVNGGGEDLISQFGGGAISTEMPCSSLEVAPLYYASPATGNDQKMLGNVMFKSLNPEAITYPSMKSTLQYRQLMGPQMAITNNNVTSSKGIPRFSEFCEINKFAVSNEGSFNLM